MILVTKAISIYILNSNRNYLTGWFLIDLLGTFPFEKIINGESASRKSLKVIKYFKIPKLLRISRMMKYFRVRRRVYDVFQVVVLVFTFLHFGACIWMLVLNPCDDEHMTSDICAQSEVSNIYAESFHLSAAMMLGVSNFHVIGSSTTLDLLVKRKEQNVALIYHISTVLMISGLFLVALLMSELNVFVFGKKQGSAAFQRKVDRVNYEMEYYEIPDHLQMQVKAFYDYVWIHQKQYDDRVALLSDDQMSTDLKRKLALHLFKDVISHISIFSDIDDLLLGQICLSLRSRIFLPGDIIIHKGDIGKELFIITKGVVEVLRDDLPLEKRLSASSIFLESGSFFGEIALIMETRRTCSVQAKTVCDVNTLDQLTFDTILRENPDFARRMNELVVARQLERSISKAGNDEVDCQVSLSDMDTAVSAVERNMKLGLERRMRFRSEKYCSEDNISDIQRNSESSSLSSGPAFLHSHRNEVSQLIEDIARRSTRSKAGSVYDVESHSCVKTLMESNDLNDIESVVNDRGNYITDDQTRLVTGGYIPKRMAIDMSKVHPSILNSGKDEISQTKLASKLDEQNLLIKKLTDKLEKLSGDLEKNGEQKGA